MYLNTARVPWVSLREAGDDAPRTAFTYSDWPTSGVLNKVRSNGTLKDINGVLIAMFGANAANEDARYWVFGRVRQIGPILMLLTGIATLGTQTAAVHPLTGATITNGLWVDTITVDGGIYEDLTDVLDSANNRIAMLKFDIGPIEDLRTEFDLDGGGTDSASMYAMITGY